MGADWDKALPDPAVWRECLRVLKPGGLALVMALPRMYHRLAVAVEDAGFIVHSPIIWTFATGFPKALDVGKQIDKMAGKAREVMGRSNNKICLENLGQAGYKEEWDLTAPATPLAREWDGWKVGNSCLKPAYELVGWFQKPPSEKTLVANVLKHGVGAINVRAGAIPYKSDKDKDEGQSARPNSTSKGMAFYEDKESDQFDRSQRDGLIGRFPANLLVEDDVLNDGRERVSNGGTDETTQSIGGRGSYQGGDNRGFFHYGDSGSFSRYFSLDSWFDKLVSNLPPEVQRTFPFLIVPRRGRKKGIGDCDLWIMSNDPKFT